MRESDASLQHVLDTITPSAFTGLLIGLGWSLHSEHPVCKVFKSQNGQSRIVVPSDITLADYERRLVEAIQDLSKAESKTIEELFADLPSATENTPQRATSNSRPRRSRVTALVTCTAATALASILWILSSPNVSEAAFGSVLRNAHGRGSIVRSIDELRNALLTYFRTAECGTEELHIAARLRFDNEAQSETSPTDYDSAQNIDPVPTSNIHASLAPLPRAIA